MGDNIVENWLKSIELEKYAQAFVDNGYDDLEICKQVGGPDLDAIGVESPSDREIILDAVKTLKEKGGTAVYLTLEDESNKKGTKEKSEHVPTRPTLDNLLSDVPPPSPGPPPTPKKELENEGADENYIIYQKIELTCIVRDKLTEDRIDLASPPYTLQNWSPCWSSLTALAVKYAEELRTRMEEVLDRLEDLRWWKISEDTASIYTPPSMTSSTMEDHYNQSLYSYSPRGGPPPIPSVPPPDGTHAGLYAEDSYGQLQSVQTRYTDNPSTANYVALETGMCCVFPKKVTKDSEMSEKKKTSTLGRLFRNMGFRRSSRKHSYKKHSGDLVAHEITMSDNDRIALMQMVKEGKISTETALQVVKRFEEERKREEQVWEHAQEKHEKKSKSKKSSTNKPTKSPSITSTDDSKCDVCRSVMSNFYPSSPCTPWRGYHDDCCRHHRVHSVSHITYPDTLRSPGSSGRAMSCSPMRSHSTQPSAINSPVNYAATNQGSKIYTPVIPHELKMYSGSRAHYAVHGIDLLRDRLNVIKTSACVHKTQSKASLISSESDHSMDFGSHLVSQMDPQMDETYYCSNNSTTSMGSDTVPGANGRRKCGSAMDKLCSHKWQRTGSLSQGEDGMSTDNDDLDDPDRYLIGGGTASSHMIDKFRGVKNEMRKRILHTRDMIGDGKSQYLCSAYQPTAVGTSHSVSSTDSCSSGHGSQSSHNEMQKQQQWAELETQGQGPWLVPIIGMARVHSNYSPSPDEKDFLSLRQGEKVQILEITSSGIWKGRIDNRVGYFHFNYVDMITEATPVMTRKEKPYRRTKRRSKPKSVEDLLQRIGLDHLTSVFIMNGYDNLEIFAEIDHEDLNALNILDSESRTKLVTAANLLMDYEGNIVLDLDTPDETASIRSSRSASATPTSQQYAVPWTSFFPSKHLTGSRDSGCYDSSECMSREHDPYACLNRNRLLGGCMGQDNKENYRPASTKKNMKLRPDQCLHSNGANLFSPSEGFVPKLERIYSEEDQEVCNITGFHNGSQRSSPRSQTGSTTNGLEKNANPVPNRNLTLNIPVLGPDWKFYADAYCQTSPKYGSLSDSYHSSADGEPGSAMSVSAHGDIFGQKPSTLKHKSKPFARKIAPVVPMRDIQVQVMCPLGFFPQQFSPSSPQQVIYTSPNVGSTDKQSDLNLQTASIPLLFQTNFENEQFNSLVKYENKTPTRTSHLSQSSQNSRDGDSGSDASTVKSDIFLDGKEGGSRPGSNTPDALYGPIHKGFKSIKRSVIPKVTSKLASENIDLAAEPYSSQTGANGVPPLLVQRYAEELKQDLFKTALILDQIRIHKLTTVGRSVVVADQLGENSLATSELKISSVTEFFVSIGLPMYSEAFTVKGYTAVESLVNMSIKELQSITGADRKHLKRIIHALEWVQSRLQSPSRKAKSSPVKDRV